MRCYICDSVYTYKGENIELGVKRRKVVKTRDGKYACTDCIRRIKEDLRYFKPYVQDKMSYDISRALAELETRIPSLFTGPTCPGNQIKGQGCHCTYSTGCNALKRLTKKSS